jgi:NTE family protein
VDLFPTRGALPGNLNEVTERDKDIRYSSRTRAGTDTLRRLHDLRHSINMLWERLPENLKRGPEVALLDEFRCVTTMDIVELIYRPEHALGQSGTTNSTARRWKRDGRGVSPMRRKR